MLRLLQFLSRPVLFFYALPWLMLLLVLGTVAQRYDGLYLAERTYFSSFILWAGFVPLPGGLSVLALIALNLLARLLLQKNWGGRKLGTTVTHVSVLLLLLGGGITLMGREEGFLELAPTTRSAVVTDYHQREFVVIKNGALLQQTSYESLKDNQDIAGLPFGLRVIGLCRHCAAEALTQAAPDRRGAAQKMRLQDAPLQLQDEENLSGVTLAVTGLDSAQNGIHIAFAGLREAASLTVGADRYQLVLRRAERSLPFTVRLEKFHKIEHPGTRIAKAYRSDITVIDGDARWPVTIAMNEPLRYRGYTLYQSSFVETPEAVHSVLTVVKDAGQVFPYLAVAAMCLGMVIHLLGLPRRRGNAAGGGAT